MEINILTRQVRVGEEAIRLSGIELSLLYALASRAGQVVSPPQLIAAIWGSALHHGGARPRIPLRPERWEVWRIACIDRM
ncbi:MAG: winged helix-turn-helix domain-containing protein [Candidatus Limnocylindrales bacterium]